MRALALLLLLLVPAAARAQEAAPVGSVTTTSAWVTSLGNKGAIGREEVRLETKGERAALVSTAELTLTATPFTYSARLELEGGRPRRYVFDSNVGRLEVAIEGAKVTIGGAIAGNPVSLTAEASGPVVVLDNLVCAHYDQLAALALGLVDGELRFTAVVPQVVRLLPATLAVGPALRVVGPDGERPARRSTVTVGNVAVTLIHDAERPLAYAVRVPAQGLDCARDGWREVRVEQGPAPVDRGEERGELPPRPPARMIAVEVDAPHGAFEATLTLPVEGEGPWPCVIFLHGSGPQDKDETIGPNKPFRDLAHQLAARGVASLRWDKRTFRLVAVLRDPASTDAQRQAANLELRGMTLIGEAVDDGVAALRFLATRAEARPDALVVLGHSLGGIAAPEVVLRAGEGVAARGLVLVAAPGRPLLELMTEQLTFQSELLGATPEKAARDAAATLAPLRDQAKHLGEEASFMGASGRYWRDLLARDPCAALAACPLPVLLVQGGKDCQVSVKDHERLAAAAGERATARLFPGLNHLLARVAGERSTGAEYALPARVDEAVADAIAAWLQELLRRAE